MLTFLVLLTGAVVVACVLVLRRVLAPWPSHWTGHGW
jgi:hypothetical protein